MSDSQSEYSDDFLGIPPSEEPLSSGEQSDRTVEEEEEDETQPENNDPITVVSMMMTNNRFGAVIKCILNMKYFYRFF